jgi:hypothetical protein
MRVDRDKAIEACDLARDAWNAALSAQVADLYAQVAELRKDAERYQWLKKENPTRLFQIAWKYSAACTDEVNERGIDAVIDAAKESGNE